MTDKIFQSHGQFEMTPLIEELLRYRWQHECQIIPDYMPPYPGDDTKPSCVVRLGNHFLRYSHGPGTGTFWDAYGDNFLRPELALVALAKAAPPPGATGLAPTHGNAYEPWPKTSGE